MEASPLIDDWQLATSLLTTSIAEDINLLWSKTYCKK